MTKNDQLYSQLAVMARLSNFVHNIWSMITIKQTKRDLNENIEKIKSQIEMVKSETFTFDEVAEFLLRNKQVDQDAYEKYNQEFSQNQEVQTKTREVFIHFTRKIFELIEQHLEIDQFDEETDRLDTNVDPTNLGVERSFGIMKFFESCYASLSFGTLSALTISKFNDLPQWLDTFTNEKLFEQINRFPVMNI